MKLAKGLIAGALALAILGAATPSHAVYQKVETYDDLYAIIESSDCTILSVECTQVRTVFGFDESHVPQKFAYVEMYAVSFAGPTPTVTLIAEGNAFDANLHITFLTNRKAASLQGYLDIYSAPCDQQALTCSGPIIGTPWVEALAQATSSKSGSIKKQIFQEPGCKITRGGTYSARKGKAGYVSFDTVEVYPAINRSGSVWIERDKMKITSVGCLSSNAQLSVTDVAAARIDERTAQLRSTSAPPRPKRLPRVPR